MTEKKNKFYIWIVGDKYLLADYGQISSIECSLKAVLLKNMILKEKICGVIDLVPSNSSLLIGYDPLETNGEDLKKTVNDLMEQIELLDNILVPSRLIEIPVLFDDPWTNESVEHYCRTIKPIENNIQKIIKDNGLKDLEELIYYYSFPEFLVCYVGFWPGLASALCLDPRFNLSVEKYNPPRTSTPKGAVGIGGANTSIYPMDTPGGFQLFGITPAPIYDSEGKLEAFKDTSVLCRVTDRLKFKPISLEEYNKITAQVEGGTYRYNIVEYAQFDLNAYKEFVKSVSGTKEGE